MISARIADVHDELKKLLSHLSDLPSAASVQQVQGPHASVTGPFSRELGAVATEAAKATEAVIAELNDTDSAIRAALDDLATLEVEISQVADRVDPTAGGSPASNGKSRSGYGNY